MTYILGIDIGTGSTKAVAIDPAGSVLHAEQVAYPTHHPQPDASEQDPEVIWQACVQSIRQTLAHLKQAPAGLSFSSAMHSVLPVNAEGKPLRPLMTWADNRSAAIATSIHHSAAAQDLYRHTGTPIHAMSPLAKIAWLQANEPAVFAQAARFISIKEYIWFNLFGVWEIDYSLASACGLFDILAHTWYTPALALAGITADRLSVPVSTQHIRTGLLPATARLTGLPATTPCCIGASDGCSANLGSSAITPGVAALTIGTSGAIRVASSQPVYNFEAMTFNYILTSDIFISGGPVNNGGAALKWYAQELLKIDLSSPERYAALLAEIGRIPAGADGLVFLPYLAGERAPLWNSDACGVFFGLTGRHTQAHFTRAVLEGISMALYHIATKLEESGLSIGQVNVSGGFVRSEEWVQLMADIFGKPIGLVNVEDASAIGAGYLALHALGMIPALDALHPKTLRTYLPRPEYHAVYRDRAFPLFRSLTRNLTLDMAVHAEVLAPVPTKPVVDSRPGASAP
ncbi:gluconokinase [Parachryseolinea silvisoli]|uniref:gluconokinase n=1 Tax=Parachryseolinea silvisoli TaxID=2873601 RepID=UPI002265D4EC|nr:gluconokinase [Parachryseolinea silvisoli]MCD9019008.1 gluconokinase [Parachryseolinea silvisoli]